MENYTSFAVNLARQAGTIIRNNFTFGMQKEWKADNSPVTATDQEINTLVLNAVKSSYPEHSVLGEEGSFTIEGSPYVWVCDPVDGTIPFSTSVPLFTFSLALVLNGQPILGVIYDPMLDRMFIGEEGKPTTLNQQPIHVSQKESFEQSIIHGDIFNLLEAMRMLRDLKAKTPEYYTATYPAVLVAAGEFDGMIWAGKTAWDMAAVKIIVEGAGGKVTNLEGNEQRYDQPLSGTIISNGYLHDQLLTLVQDSLR